MKLAELIDLEVQLQRDERVDVTADTDGGAEARRRDRAIGLQLATELSLDAMSAAQRLASDRELRHLVCAAWLERLPSAAKKELPGHRIESGYRLIGWALFVLFCLGGMSASAGALSSRGDAPVNALVFIVVFFVLQIALLVGYPVLLLLRKLRGGDALTWLEGLVVRLSRIRLVDKLAGRGLSDLPSTIGRLKSRQTVYGRAQHWLLFTLVQRMATGFNAAALLTAFYMVTFHDIAFAWSTTLDVSPQELHRGLSAIAAPWSWLGDLSAPTEEAIRFSRFTPTGYEPLPAGMDQPHADSLRRSWWPFLVAGLITWGLLPRLLAFCVGSTFERRTRERIALNHMAIQHLFERLFPPPASWQGPDPADVMAEARPIPKGAVAAPVHATPTGPCGLVCWGTLHETGDRVRARIARRFGHEIQRTAGAGQADVDSEERAIAGMQSLRAGRVVLALPEGQQPTKDVMRFVTAVRARLGPECELVVVLLAVDGEEVRDVDADEHEPWRHRLLAEGDPYLSLQTLEVRK